MGIQWVDLFGLLGGLAGDRGTGPLNGALKVLSSLMGLEAKLGLQSGLARMRPALKDASTWRPGPNQTGLDLTLFLEDVSDSSPPTLCLGTKYLTLLF